MDWLAGARELRERGEIGRAIELLERAIAGGDESAEICKETAKMCLLVNELRAFSNYCHEAMRLDPSDAEPHLMIAHVLVKGKRWEEAVEALQGALRMTTLSAEQRGEAQQLLAASSSEFENWKRANPGYSNL